jgi:hypothetical protein
LHTLYDNRWLIGGITALITLMAVLYALVAKPVYEANLMIHVEEESPNASKNILSEASSLFETKKAAIAEMELLRSRMVVSRAVDNLQLYIDVRPKYFPLSASGSPTRMAARCPTRPVRLRRLCLGRREGRGVGVRGARRLAQPRVHPDRARASTGATAFPAAASASCSTAMSACATACRPRTA